MKCGGTLIAIRPLGKPQEIAAGRTSVPPPQ